MLRGGERDAHRQVSADVTQTLDAPAANGVAVFDDRKDYYDESIPGVSVKTAGHGVVATVTQDGDGAISVRVANP